MKVGLLTLEQKEEIQYQLFAPDSYFCAVLDGNGNWIITQQQINYCVNPDYLWVKELPLIDWVEPEEEQ
jgi:hypothetical protein